MHSLMGNKPKSKVKKYTVFLTIFISFGCIALYAQQAKDTLITVNNYSKYIALTCVLREDIIKAVKTNDTLAIKTLRNATIVFPISNEQTLKSRLITAREDQMLQFYRGAYQKLLFDVKNGNDYFLSPKKTGEGYGSPNFDCGNLTLATLMFWKSQSAIIHAEVQRSALTTPEKELLILYWDAILLYLEGEKTLSLDINKKARAYLDKYPDTKYKNFIENLSRIKRIVQPNGVTLGFALGKSYPVGVIDSYLNTDFAFEFVMGYTLKGWDFQLGYRLHSFEYRGAKYPDHIDTIQIKQGSSLEYDGFALKIGYTVFGKEWFRVQPFISGELNKFTNYIEIPDSAGIRQKGKTHGALGIGTEVGLRLIRNVIEVNKGGLYYLHEEKDRPYNPLFLTLRAGYYPNVFKKSMDISGGIFYWTIGLEWIIGRNQVNYRYKK